MMNTILVVCMGNICRSPIGERMLKKLLENKEISSAGISALTGSAADERARLIAQQRGLSLAGHKAQQLSKEMCSSHELILIMEKAYIDSVCRIAPQARGKVMLFGYWQNKCDIPDPYRQSKQAYEHVYRLLDESANAWANVLNR